MRIEKRPDDLSSQESSKVEKAKPRSLEGKDDAVAKSLPKGRGKVSDIQKVKENAKKLKENTVPKYIKECREAVLKFGHPYFTFVGKEPVAMDGAVIEMLKDHINQEK